MRPLDGITIVDFSRVLAGPMATMILAEMGARVIKIERPGTGDESRQWEPRVGGESAYFFAFNRGKESIALDLKTPAGRDAARKLALQADVVLENFLPGQMNKMGLGYAELSREKPALVYVSNTGFGQNGPYRDRVGYDTIFQALSGVMALTGHPDGPPAKVGVPMADLTAGLWNAVAILTGLVGRGSSGKGCHIDLSMLDTQISLLTIAAARLFAFGEDPRRTGTEHPGRVPSAAFACAGDEWLHISGSDQHWQAICSVLGLDELAADAALARNSERVAQRDRIMAAMRDALLRRDRSEVAEALRGRGVPAGEVNTVAQALADPHVQARGMVAKFEHPGVGTFSGLRNPLRFTGYDDPYFGTPPLHGADGAALASEFDLKEFDT
ncbi:CaiB/BaiF CoA transferase family protein [Bosea sp. 2KB_26]|uniref:CaiB/BaiF CoA transferase family protein n=1 Tax=Bosea sp. 2KB_26 TaxID=3237475 RepID=UPI003F93C7FB